MNIARQTATSISALALLIVATQSAQALPTAGASFNVKVIASSTGAPCSTNCWERWKEVNNLGFIMVEKDSAGHIVRAGRLSDPYFKDLVASTDEAIHTSIPIGSQSTMYGTVRTVDAGCTSYCVFTVDFGYHADVTLAINSSGTLTGSKEIDDAVLIQAPDGSSPPDGHPQCPNNGIGCAGGSHWTGGGYRNGGAVQIWVEYDDYGNVVAIVYVYADGHEERVPV